MIKLYTIGFTRKSAETFFHLLKTSGAKKIIDIRLNNKSQLAGFAKGTDLKYFARQIADLDYQHINNFAPSHVLLKQYRKREITWDEYLQKSHLGAKDIEWYTEMATMTVLKMCDIHAEELSFQEIDRNLISENPENYNIKEESKNNILKN